MNSTSNYFNIDEEDLMQKIENNYKGHHVFIDEVGIYEAKDISLLKKVAQKLESLSFWVSVTYIDKQKLEDTLRTDLESEFTIIKDELNVPLRNPKSIVAKAYGIGKFFCLSMIMFYPSIFQNARYFNY